MNAFAPYTAALRDERQYRFMIAANAVSRFGDSIDVIAFSWMIYELTGSASWLAVLVGVNMLPAIFLQPFTGALASYLDQKKMVVLCDFARGAIVCATGVCMLTGVLNIGLLLACTLLNSCFEAVRVPCGLALLPRVLQKENYKAALSLNQGVSRVCELLGLGAAGAVIAALGAGGALLVDAATFVVSGVLLWCMRPRACAEKTPQGAEKADVRGYLAHLREGFGYFKTSRAVLTLCLLCVAINVTLIPVENMSVAFVKETLLLGLAAVSAGSVCLTIGTVLGAFCYPLVSQTLSAHRVFTLGGLAVGALYFAFLGAGLLPQPGARTVAYAAVCLIFGVCNSLVGMAVQIQLVSTLPEQMLGRVGGFFQRRGLLVNTARVVCHFVCGVTGVGGGAVPWHGRADAGGVRGVLAGGGCVTRRRER